jgi:hypothetical protein
MASPLLALPQPIRTAQYISFNPQTQQFDLSQQMIYQFPDPSVHGNGPYPVFMWTPGTFESFRDALSISFITQMSARGFVGVSVQYSNWGFGILQQNCNGYTKRAQGVFDSARTTSAVSVVCSMTGVSCAHGIVTSGVSQGAALAILAKNYAPSVRAVYAMSVSNYNNTVGLSLSSCLDKAFTAIPANRLVIVNGQSDPFFGGQAPVENVSGFTCPLGSFQCWSPGGNGAGWYIVPNSRVSDGLADHCYMLKTGCGYSQPEPNWISESRFNWGMQPNLDWLASFGMLRTFSVSGH